MYIDTLRCESVLNNNSRLSMTRPTFTIYFLRLLLLPRLLLPVAGDRPQTYSRDPGGEPNVPSGAHALRSGASRRSTQPGCRNFRHTTHSGHTYSAGQVMKASALRGRHQPLGSGARILMVRPREKHETPSPSGSLIQTSGGEPQSISGRLLPSP